MMMTTTATTTSTTVTAARQNSKVDWMRLYLRSFACSWIGTVSSSSSYPLSLRTDTHKVAVGSYSCFARLVCHLQYFGHNKTQALFLNWIQLWFDCRWVSTTHMLLATQFIHSFIFNLVHRWACVSVKKYHFTRTSERTNECIENTVKIFKYLHALANCEEYAIKKHYCRRRTTIKTKSVIFVHIF